MNQFEELAEYMNRYFDFEENHISEMEKIDAKIFDTKVRRDELRKCREVFDGKVRKIKAEIAEQGKEQKNE